MISVEVFLGGAEAKHKLPRSPGRTRLCVVVDVR